MEKKNIILVITLLIITISGCKTSNLPKHKKHNQIDTFIEINGLKIPTLSDDKKFYRDTKVFKKDRKNSIDYGVASKIYKKNDNGYDNSSYRKATENFLIVSSDGKSYEDIVYDKSNLYYNKYDIKRYNFKDGILQSVGNYWMIYRDLKEEILITEKPTKQLINKLTSNCQYFPNGQLKSFSIYFGNLINDTNSTGLFNAGNECYIGTWYKFNESGEIIQTIDFEKDYKTSFLDIFLISRKKINELKGNTAIKFSRYLPSFKRNKNELGSFWQLFIAENYYLIIDDATGKIIEEVKSDNYEETQKLFTKYMTPTVDYKKNLNNFFEIKLF
ncbi:MAG: hypothetical protein V4666_09940 [Bacteroidota bacterium]